MILTFVLILEECICYAWSIYIYIYMFLGSKARLVRRADNLTAIYEPIVWTVWDP
jgi:hypothetical protein